MGEVGDGIKKGTCDELPVLCGSVESLHSAPEADITLHVH